MNASLKTFLESLSGQITEDGLRSLCDYYSVPFHEARNRVEYIDLCEIRTDSYDEGFVAGAGKE